MEFLYRDDSSRRTVITHHLSVDGIYCGPELHVRNVNCHLQDSTQIASGGVENRSDVFEALLGLFFDWAEESRAGCRIDWELSGDVDEPVVNDCLRVVPARRWR